MFEYFIQYGGDPHYKFGNMGATDFNHFMNVFDGFPWMEEMVKANTKGEGSSPTLSVRSISDDMDLWVSMAGSETTHGYLLGYSYCTPKRRWLGLRNPKMVRWLEIYLTRDMSAVKHYFHLYFTGNYRQLLTDIRKLQRYTALETPN